MNYRAKLTELADIFLKEQYGVRVLKNLCWHPSVRQDFFRTGKLPPIVWANTPSFNPSEKREALLEIAARAGTLGGGLGGLLGKMAKSYSMAAYLVGVRGVGSMFRLSSQLLYGTGIGIKKVEKIGLEPEFNDSRMKDYDAKCVVKAIRLHCAGAFPGADIRVKLTDRITSRVSVFGTTIKVNKNAAFSTDEIESLIAHELFGHVISSLNARRQPVAKWLRCLSPHAVATAEGLAVYIEKKERCLTAKRVDHINDRVRAVAMAEEGATFVDIYKWFLGKTGDRKSSFASAQRVFRGGEVGIFTKDAVYARGLHEVEEYLDSGNRATDLFAGKVALSDTDVIARGVGEGLIEPPLYMPPSFEQFSKSKEKIAVVLDFCSRLGGRK